ncbi:hypothetical protein F5Y09DRAFT_330757 [Xylaria sp. FL1042]|nr:hypothetical protein F5Y09DRAFT_330757 [Xylaria sp. FL1042]
MPVLQKGKLRGALPASGMKYQSSFCLMHNKRRDRRVTHALKAAGYEITCAVITEVLVHMFQIATPIASNLPQPIFFEFFVCLIQARCEWEEEPEFPYHRYELYNQAVLELIAFRKSTGDCGANNVSWILTDAVFFNELARGFDIDEDEDEDVMMDDTNLDQEDHQQDNEDPVIADVVPPMAQMKIE